MQNGGLDAIILGRLDGKTGRAIAAEMGVSYQYIYSILARFPQNPYVDSYVLNVDKATAHSICSAYLKLLPPSFLNIDKSLRKGILKSREQVVDIQNAAATAVARNMGLGEYTVLNTLCSIRSRKCSTGSKYTTSPEIEKWFNTTGMSLTELSKRAEIEYGKLLKGLSGKQPFSLHNAQKLSSVTGLPVEKFLQEAGGF